MIISKSRASESELFCATWDIQKKRLENNGDAPSKTNMEPEHEPLEEEIPIFKPSFSGSMLVFRGDKLPTSTGFFSLDFWISNHQLRERFVRNTWGLGNHGCRFGGLRLGWLGLRLAIQWSGVPNRKEKVVGRFGWLVWLVVCLAGCSGYSHVSFKFITPPNENLDPVFLEGWDCEDDLITRRKHAIFCCPNGPWAVGRKGYLCDRGGVKSRLWWSQSDKMVSNLISGQPTYIYIYIMCIYIYMYHLITLRNLNSFSKVP